MYRLRHSSLLLLLVATASHAGTAYKCVNAKGGITYQDHACAGGDKETQIAIDTPATPKADDAPADAMPAPAAEAPPPPSPSRPSKPLPPLWVCTRPEDGKQYTSTDGVVQPRLVPLGVMGYPGKSLASAYGPGKIGVSAPELSKPPIAKAGPGAAVAGDYTQVQDDCVQASPSQTCDYLRSEFDRIREKLRRAFKDVRAELEPRANELEDQINSCPD
jgi:Domain of unknown function (DUF4124)